MRNIHLKDAQWESTVLLSGSEEAPLIQDRSRDGEREKSPSSDMDESDGGSEDEYEVMTPPRPAKRRFAEYDTSLFSWQSLPIYDPNRWDPLPDLSSQAARSNIWTELVSQPHPPASPQEPARFLPYVTHVDQPPPPDFEPPPPPSDDFVPPPPPPPSDDFVPPPPPPHN